MLRGAIRTSEYQLGAVVYTVFLRQLIKRLTLVSELAYVTTHFNLPSSPHFVADFLHAKCNFTRKTAVLWFWCPLWGLRGNARCSSYRFHWKTRSEWTSY